MHPNTKTTQRSLVLSILLNYFILVYSLSPQIQSFLFDIVRVINFCMYVCMYYHPA